MEREIQPVWLPNKFLLLVAEGHFWDNTTGVWRKSQIPE
jgi:hypothetical protein